MNRENTMPAMTPGTPSLLMTAILCSCGCSKPPFPKVEDLLSHLRARGLRVEAPEARAPSALQAGEKAKRLIALARGNVGPVRTMRRILLEGIPCVVRKFKSREAARAFELPALPGEVGTLGRPEEENFSRILLRGGRFVLELRPPLEESGEIDAVLARIRKALRAFEERSS